jgi:nucleotide-binding universal stress UspA family protein
MESNEKNMKVRKVTMFKHILVPLDGSSRSERAIPLAIRLAQAEGGKLLLARIVDETQEKIPGRLRQAYAALLATCRQIPTNLPAHCLVHVGPVVPSLLDLCSKQHVDCIVLCSRGETGIAGMIHHSVTQQLANQSNVPLLVLRPESPIPASAYPDPSRPFHPITALVPLDGSPQAEQAIGPALSLVAALTAPASGTLHLLHLLPEWTGSLAQTCIYEHAHEYLKTLITQTIHAHTLQTPINVVGTLIEGSTVRSGVVRVAEEGTRCLAGCEFVVMTTHQRATTGTWVAESFTEYVLEHSKLAVLIVPSESMRVLDPVFCDEIVISQTVQ